MHGVTIKKRDYNRTMTGKFPLGRFIENSIHQNFLGIHFFSISGHEQNRTFVKPIINFRICEHGSAAGKLIQNRGLSRKIILNDRNFMAWTIFFNFQNAGR